MPRLNKEKSTLAANTCSAFQDRHNSLRPGGLRIRMHSNIVAMGTCLEAHQRIRLPPWRPETGRRSISQLQQQGFSQWPCELQSTDNLPTSLPVAWFYGHNIGIAILGTSGANLASK